MEKKFLAAGMIITCAGIFAFSSNNGQHLPIKTFSTVQNQDIPVATEDMPALRAVIDTVPDNAVHKEAISHGTFNSTVNGKKYKVIVENDVVTQLYVNGKKIPASKIPDYKAVTGKILAQAKVDMQHSQEDLQRSREDLEESKKEMEEARLEMEESREAMSQVMEQTKKEIEEQRNEINHVQEESNREVVKHQEEMTRAMNQVRLEQSRIMARQSKKEMEQVKLEIELSQKKMGEDMEQAKMRLEEAKRNITQSKIDMEKSMRAMEKSSKDMAESKKLQESVITDLIKEKIIKNRNELSSYKLSNEELIVNGVKQPAGVHKKFKERYVKGNNWTIMYNYDRDNEAK